MGEQREDRPSGYALFRVEPSHYEIDRAGRHVGHLFRDRWGWVAELFPQDAHPAPAPFSKREHRFPMLVNALIWLGHPPRGERAATAGAARIALRSRPSAPAPLRT